MGNVSVHVHMTTELDVKLESGVPSQPDRPYLVVECGDAAIFLTWPAAFLLIGAMQDALDDAPDTMEVT